MKQDLESALSSHALLHTPIGIVITDNNENISWVNLAFCEYLVLSMTEVVGKKLTALALEASTTTPGLYLISATTEQTSPRWLLNVNSPTIDSQNGTQIIRYFVDVSENIRLREEIHQLSREVDDLTAHDALTGLMNKKALVQALAPQISRSRRYDNPLSIVVLEVLSVLTSQGESIPMVESIVSAMSAYFRDQLRWVDLIGRTGDSEFTLVLPETSEASAQKLVQKVDQHLENLALPTGGRTVKIVAKYGVSQWHKGEDMALILQHAKSNPYLPKPDR